ncbi:MAG: electron transfer flavoprotein subunit beta/FixA family protein [Thermodesulfobacteriota bacterium]|nr:MAG: electron transfer flavoprotein subunit beta/FixA family protein [Thermodesulfobacteriota bacterium]
MDIIVCLKRVPDTGVEIEIEEGGLETKEAGLPWVLNPYDEYAVEEAVRIKERFAGRVTVITAGSEGGEEVLKKAIAMGADEAVYVTDAGLKGLDGRGIAMVLSRVISKMPFDLILCGKQGTDTDSGMVGGAVAGLLNIPLVSAIKSLKVFPDKNHAEAHREVERGVEVIECPLPALFTAQKGLNEPRYPSLPGIMRAKKHEIRYLDLSSIGIKKEAFQSPFNREGLSHPALKRKGIIFKGDLGDAVNQTVKFLKEEIKVL